MGFCFVNGDIVNLKIADLGHIIHNVNGHACGCAVIICVAKGGIIAWISDKKGAMVVERILVFLGDILAEDGDGEYNGTK